MPLSLSPNDRLSADSFAEQWTTSTRQFQEAVLPPPSNRSRATAGTAYSSFLSLLLRIHYIVLAGTSRVSFCVRVAAMNTHQGYQYYRPPPRTLVGTEAVPTTVSRTTSNTLTLFIPLLLRPLVPAKAIQFGTVPCSFPFGTRRLSQYSMTTTTARENT